MDDLAEESVHSLFNKLCELQVQDNKKCHVIQPRLSKHQKLCKLKNKLYDTLYQSLRGPHSNGDIGAKSKGDLTVLQQIYSKTFDLRQKKRYDDADRLEYLVEKLMKDDEAENHSVLTLLVKLAGSGSGEVASLSAQLPVVVRSEKHVSNLPAGPRVYGDSRTPADDSFYYTHFPSSVFESLPDLSCIESSVHSFNTDFNKVFECEPGTGLTGFFSNKGMSGEPYMRDVASSLFGALVEGRTQGVDVTLDLPEIDATQPAILHMIRNRVEVSEDEGFGDSQSSGRGSMAATPEFPSPPPQPNIWEQALVDLNKPKGRYVWENVGVAQLEPEKPYVSEAGARAFDELYRVHCGNLSTLLAEAPRPRRQIDMQELMDDLINLLIGVPSTTFIWDENSESFRISPGTLLTGMSMESVATAVLPFLHCGNHYQRLDSFSRPPTPTSRDESGLVFQAFAGGIRKFLQHYRACILMLSTKKAEMTLMWLRFRLNKLLGQMRYLAEICKVDDESLSTDNRTQFPWGVRLLSYLYREALNGLGSDHYSILLGLLSTAATPYLLFIQDWVYHGVCRDVYAEFMIQVNEEYLQYRDEQYWSHGYTLADPDGTEPVPLFLSHLATDLFVCGKSINLLRIIAPQHFLFSVGELSLPPVSFNLSQQHLEEVEDTCQAYLSRMLAILSQTNKARLQRESEREAAAVALMVEARRTAVARIQQLQARIDAARRAQDISKRKLFAQLQQQMESDLQRRASERAAEKASDRARMDEVEGHELLEASKDVELERQAREELLEYYAKLSADATLREQRALWHVRRRQLQLQRNAFLEEDEKKLQEEMELQVENRTSGLPSWAQVPADQPTRFIGDDSEEPETGTKDNQLERTDFGLGDITTDDMLNWAKRAIESGQTEPILVHDLPEKPQGHPSDSTVGSLLQGDSDDSGKVEKVDAKTKDSDGKDSGGVTTVHKEMPSEVDLPRDEGDGKATVVKSHRQGSTVQDLLYGERQEKRLDEKKEKPLEEKITEKSLEEKTQEKSLEEKITEKSLEEKITEKSLEEKITEKSLEEKITEKSLEEKITEKSLEEKITEKSLEEKGEENRSEESCESKTEKDEISELPDKDKKNTESTENQETSANSKPENDNTSGEIQEKQAPKSAIATDFAAPVSLPSSMPLIKPPLTGPIRKTPPKQHIKLIEGAHATKESAQDTETKSSVKIDAARNIMCETEEVASKSSIKVGPMHSSVETQAEISTKSSIRSSGEITRESEEKEERHHLKTFEGKHANIQSEEIAPKAHLKPSTIYNATKESVPAPVKVYKPSVYGHTSEISTEEFSILAPKLKRQADQHASVESNWLDRSFTVKSGRRKVKGQEISKQTTSDEQTEFRPKVHMSDRMHSSKESEYVDHDAQRLEKFKDRNVYGHFGDSTVQRLLYGKRTGGEKEQESDPGKVVPLSEMLIETDYEVEKYQDDFKILDQAPLVDLLSSVPSLRSQSAEETERDMAHHYVPLPSLLNRSVTAPLSAQIQLVNQCVISHIMEELNVQEHFKALRRFLLMKDGEFAQSLADQLFEKLGSNPRSHEVLNPVFLNNVLARALRSSIHGDHPTTQNLSFILRYLPTVLQVNAPNALDCLELTYKVSWPLNIIVTERCVSRYGRLFSLMLQLKRTVWTLKDMWHTLKRDAMMHQASSGAQFRRLQLYRHEMQHFVKVMQGYLAHQVVHVSWDEFQTQLKDIRSLDHLHHTHISYLNKCLFRCLLNEKAAPVMKIIQDIFALILKFRGQLTSSPWQQQGSEVIHPAFEKMCATYKAFSDFSRFLFKVVTKLAMRGYQPHLQELLQRLNFNDYYDNQRTTVTATSTSSHIQ